MSNAGVRLNVYGRDPFRFVVADSTIELTIQDKTRIQGGKEIVSDKIQLMELSDAAW